MTDFKINLRNNGSLCVVPVSVIASALLMYYFGERSTNHNDEEVYEFENLEHFDTFKRYTKNQTVNRFELIYTLA